MPNATPPAVAAVSSGDEPERITNALRLPPRGTAGQPHPMAQRPRTCTSYAWSTQRTLRADNCLRECFNGRRVRAYRPRTNPDPHRHPARATVANSLPLSPHVGAPPEQPQQRSRHPPQRRTVTAATTHHAQPVAMNATLLHKRPRSANLASTGTAAPHAGSAAVATTLDAAPDTASARWRLELAIRDEH